MALTTSYVLETVTEMNRKSGRKSHPLYQALEAGDVNLAQMRYLCKQMSIIPLYNHNMHGRMYVSCPDPELRERLAEVAYEEATGRIYADGIPHYKLYIHHAEALGISREELYATEYCASAEGMMLFLSDACSRFLEGVAAVSLVGEAQVPGLANRIAQMLQRKFGLDDKGVAFFVVHDKADEDHGDAGRSMIDRFAKTEEQRQLVINVARKSNKIRRAMFDEIWTTAQSLA